MIKIIQNTDKDKYYEELILYGDPPTLEDLQNLNLLIDVLQPASREEYSKKIPSAQKGIHITLLSDAELRRRTIYDSSLMCIMINNLGFDIPVSWIRVYLRRYKKRKRELRKTEPARLKMIHALLEESRILLKNK